MVQKLLERLLATVFLIAFGRLLSVSILHVFFLAMLLLFVYFYNVMMSDAEFSREYRNLDDLVINREDGCMLFLPFDSTQCLTYYFHLLQLFYSLHHTSSYLSYIQIPNSSDNLRPLSAFGSRQSPFLV